MTSRYLIAPSVNVFILKGTNVLLGRRANTGYMDGYLCPPGGHVEEGERPTDAALRELKEELGIAVDPEHLEFLCVAARNSIKTPYVAYEFVLRDRDYDYQNTEPEKCSELVWVEVDNLPEDVVDDFRQIIEKGVVGGAPYLEVGFDS
jgi:ADP-ribose pyrophosphatase YjhB (NUDIX family)